jgi:hypothetical protein
LFDLERILLIWLYQQPNTILLQLGKRSGKINQLKDHGVDQINFSKRAEELSEELTYRSE